MIIKRDAKEKRGEQKSELINHYRQLLKQKEDLKMQLSQVCCIYNNYCLVIRTRKK